MIEVSEDVATSEVASTRRRLTRLRARVTAPTLVLLLVLVASGGLAAWFASAGWFGGDIVHYFAERGGVPGSSEGLNDAMSGHWQPVLISVYRVMFEFIGLRYYLPYALLTIAVHLALCGVMFALLRRLAVSPWVAVGCVALLAFYGRGSEAFLVEAPVALTSAVLCGLVAMLVLERGGYRRRSVLWAVGLLLVGVMTSVVGVVAAVLVLTFAVPRAGWKVACAATVPAVVAFGVWFLVVGREAGRVALSFADLGKVPSHAGTLLVAPFEDLSVVPGVGSAVLVACVVASVLARRVSDGLRHLAWAGLLAAVLQALLSTLANFDFGIDAVTTSRYRYVVLVLLLPALALAVQEVLALARTLTDRRQSLTAPILLALLLVGVVLQGVGEEAEVRDFVAETGREHATLMRGTIAASDVGERLLTPSVEGFYFSGDDLVRVADPAVRGELPDLTPTHADRIAAETAFFTGVRRDSYRLPPPAALSSAELVPTMTTDSGCTEYTSSAPSVTIDMTSYAGAEASITTEASSVTTRLERPMARGDERTWKTDPDEAYFVATSAQVADLTMTFDVGGRFLVCLW